MADAIDADVKATCDLLAESLGLVRAWEVGEIAGALAGLRSTGAPQLDGIVRAWTSHADDLARTRHTLRGLLSVDDSVGEVSSTAVRSYLVGNWTRRLGMVKDEEFDAAHSLVLSHYAGELLAPLDAQLAACWKQLAAIGQGAESPLDAEQLFLGHRIAVLTDSPPLGWAIAELQGALRRCTRDVAKAKAAVEKIEANARAQRDQLSFFVDNVKDLHAQLMSRVREVPPEPRSIVTPNVPPPCQPLRLLAACSTTVVAALGDLSAVDAALVVERLIAASVKTGGTDEMSGAHAAELIRVLTGGDPPAELPMAATAGHIRLARYFPPEQAPSELHAVALRLVLQAIQRENLNTVDIQKATATIEAAQQALWTDGQAPLRRAATPVGPARPTHPAGPPTVNGSRQRAKNPAREQPQTHQALAGRLAATPKIADITHAVECLSAIDPAATKLAGNWVDTAQQLDDMRIRLARYLTNGDASPQRPASGQPEALPFDHNGQGERDATVRALVKYIGRRLGEVHQDDFLYPLATMRKRKPRKLELSTNARHLGAEVAGLTHSPVAGGFVGLLQLLSEQLTLHSSNLASFCTQQAEKLHGRHTIAADDLDFLHERLDPLAGWVSDWPRGQGLYDAKQSFSSPALDEQDKQIAGVLTEISKLRDALDQAHVWMAHIGLSEHGLVFDKPIYTARQELLRHTPPGNPWHGDLLSLPARLDVAIQPLLQSPSARSLFTQPRPAVIAIELALQTAAQQLDGPARELFGNACSLARSAIIQRDCETVLRMAGHNVGFLGFHPVSRSHAAGVARVHR